MEALKGIVEVEIIPVKNAEGDVNLKDALYTMGGVGVFTKQVENYLYKSS